MPDRAAPGVPSLPSLRPSLAPPASPIVLDTLRLVALRALFFLLSRRYLLSTLSPTLRSISKPAPDFALPTSAPHAQAHSGFPSGSGSG